MILSSSCVHEREDGPCAYPSGNKLRLSHRSEFRYPTSPTRTPIATTAQLFIMVRSPRLALSLRNLGERDVCFLALTATPSKFARRPLFSGASGGDFGF